MAAEEVKGLSTINTVLKAGDTGATLEKLCKIKSYPDLGGTPEKITVTDLEDEDEASIPGVRAADDMEFTANYTQKAYKAVKAKEGKKQIFELNFGVNGADGQFSWTGYLNVKISGGEVNGSRDMVISITRDSKIADEAASKAFPSV